MSRPHRSEPVKLMASVLAADRLLIESAIGELAGRYGRPDFLSSYLPFPYTDYYRDEMGEPLERRFISFEELIDPERLPAIKIDTNMIEDLFREQGARKVNIDPGYISAYNLILATGKAYAHRPYLRDGIYADLTLIYRDGGFRSLEWTYPDYAGSDVRCVLEKVRERYIVQTKELRRQAPVSAD
ncbi:MAG: DUF4416 family protein [Deltaproteobacteria bacterium]|nr:DUF4416 family protein [Deltaproteobacteria bacterium]